MKALKILAIAFCLGGALSQSSKAEEPRQELQVFAAASLADVLKEIGKEFERIRGAKVYFNFAGSNTLQVQIEKGAEADVFISAHSKIVDKLVEKQLVQDRRDLLTNSLVIITGSKNKVLLSDLSGLMQYSDEYVSLADPETVPAGIYAKQALTATGIWENLQGRMVPAVDVRAAMLQVENGNAVFGMVYRTDAVMSSKVRVVYEVPQTFYEPIVYPVCILGNSSRQDLAQQFLQFLTGEIARTTFARYGFTSL